MTYGYLLSVRSRHSLMASTATCIELSFWLKITQQKIPISVRRLQPCRCKLLRNKSNKPKIWVNFEKRNDRKKVLVWEFPGRKQESEGTLIELDKNAKPTRAIDAMKTKRIYIIDKEINEWFSYLLVAIFSETNRKHFLRVSVESRVEVWEKETHSIQVAGVCFHKFFELSKTFLSVSLTRQKQEFLFNFLNTSSHNLHGNSNMHYHILASDLFIVTSVSRQLWGHGLKESKISVQNFPGYLFISQVAKPLTRYFTCIAHLKFQYTIYFLRYFTQKRAGITVIFQVLSS